MDLSRARRQIVPVLVIPQRDTELHPDRYYLLSDGSFFFDPDGDNEGFGSPEAAAAWARTQTVWPGGGAEPCLRWLRVNERSGSCA